MNSSLKQVGGTHYEVLGIQPVQYIRTNNMDFFDGNVVKYISRHKNAKGSQDVLKCVDYCIRTLFDTYGITAELVIKNEGTPANEHSN